MVKKILVIFASLMSIAYAAPPIDLDVIIPTIDKLNDNRGRVPVHANDEDNFLGVSVTLDKVNKLDRIPVFIDEIRPTKDKNND